MILTNRISRKPPETQITTPTAETFLKKELESELVAYLRRDEVSILAIYLR